MNVSTRQPDLMNAPLPLFDMMTGQQIVSEPSAPIQTGSMTLNNADMVHVQLLDRMVVVPSAIVNVSSQ